MSLYWSANTDNTLATSPASYPSRSSVFASRIARTSSILPSGLTLDCGTQNITKVEACNLLQPNLNLFVSLAPARRSIVNDSRTQVHPVGPCAVSRYSREIGRASCRERSVDLGGRR